MRNPIATAGDEQAGGGRCLDARVIRRAARGRERELLVHVAGIPPEYLDGRHHPCPHPGCPDGPGRDRFRLIDPERGAVLCNRCFSRRNGDWLAAVQWMRGVDFREALRLAAEYLGIGERLAPAAGTYRRPTGAAAACRNAAAASNPTADEPPAPGTAARRPVRTFPTADAAIAELDRRQRKRGGRRVATWPYLNAAGQHVATVVRYNLPAPADSPKPDKTFRPVSLHPDGWHIGDPPGPWPLYVPPLPDHSRKPAVESLAARPDDPVFVVEGEKCADAAARCGLLVVAAAHGANSAAKTDWSPLAGRDVVILPDHDDAGTKAAEDYAQAACAAGAASVRILPMPLAVAVWRRDPLRDAGDAQRLAAIAGELRKGYDIADAEAECRDDAERIGLREAVMEAAASAEPWTPPATLTDALLWRPFPVACLPPPLDAFVTAAARAQDVDPALLALPVLAGCAACVGHTRVLRLKQDWQEPAILWAAVIAESGSGKSPAWRLALRPLYAADARDKAAHDEQMREYERTSLQFETAMAEWKRTGRKNGEPPPDRPRPPVRRRLIVADTTCEALRGIIAENPRGLLLASDELAGWLKSHNQYKGGKGSDTAHWLSTWDAGPWIIDRAGQHDYMPAAVVSVFGGVQPETYRAVLGTAHLADGLAARILPAWPPPRPKRWTEAEVPRDVADAMADTYERLRSLQMAEGDHGPEPAVVQLSPAAKRQWVAWHDRHAERTDAFSGAVRSAFAKLEAYCARFALVFALIRNPDTDTVGVDDMHAATTLADWFAHETQRVYTLLLGDDTTAETRQTAELVELVRRHGGRMTARDLMQASRRYRSSAAVAESALQRLVDAGCGQWMHEPTGGRPRTVFVLRADWR